jgi:hypothetical protein
MKISANQASPIVFQPQQPAPVTPSIYAN